MNKMKKHIALFMATAMVVTSLSGVKAPVQVEAASKSVTVSTQKQLISALKNKKVTNITIKSSAKKTFTLKKGTYTKKVLTINAPKATISNAATFKTIVVKNATKLSESAKGNTIRVTDSKLSVVVAKVASVKAISLEKKNAQISMTVNGTLKTLNVKAKAVVNLKGSTKKVTAVNVTATGAKITSDNKIAVSTKKTVGVTLNKNAKGSTITTKSDSAVVTVTNKTGKSVTVKKNDGTKVVVKNGKTTKVAQDKKDENPADDKQEEKPSEDNKDEEKPSEDNKNEEKPSEDNKGEEKPDSKPSEDDKDKDNQSTGGGGGSYYPGTGANRKQNIGDITKTALSSIGEVAGKKGTLTVNSDEAITYVIPDGDYTDIDLVINAPYATIENSQKFNSIKIVSIAPNTWYEFAQDNSFEIAVAGGNASILPLPGIHMVVSGNGVIGNMNVTRPVILSLEGTRRIPLTLSSDAANTRVETTAPITLESDARDITLVLNSTLAAQGTTISGREEAFIPTIRSVDSSVTIPVTIGGSVETRVPVQIYNPVNKGSVSGKVSFIGGNTVSGNTASGNTASGNTASGNTASGNTISGNTVSGKTVSLHEIGTSGLGDLVSNVTTDNNGEFTFTEISYGVYILRVEEGSKVLYTGVVNVSSPLTDIPYGEILLGGLGTSGKINGSVKSAMTGSDLSGVNVKLYRGRNIMNGAKVAENESAANGSYEFTNLESGVYTIVADHTGFVRYTKVIVVEPDGTVANPIVLSDRLAGNDHVRFILTWNDHDENNKVPSDLDSHLFTPDGHHIWYGHKLEWKEGVQHDEYDGQISAEDMEKLWARLDKDDTTYVGPETTSVYNLENGVYRFYVHQFSSAGTLAASGAVVQVYVDGIFRGAASLDANTKYVTTNGRYWDVCSYNSITNTLVINDEIKNSNYNNEEY